MKDNERRRITAIYQDVFSSSEGEAVLLDILNRCGFFSQDPSIIVPELTAFANWLLGRIGIDTAENLGTYVSSIMQAAQNIGKEKSDGD